MNPARDRVRHTASRLLLPAACCLTALAGCATSPAKGPAAPVHPVRRLAVLPMTTTPGAPDWVGELAAEGLSARLAGVARIVPVNRLQLKRLLRRSDLQPAGKGEAGAVRELARLTAADRLVIGSVSGGAQEIALAVTVLDGPTGAMVETASAPPVKESELPAALGRLAEAIVLSFNRRVDASTNPPTVTDAPPQECVALSDAQRKRLADLGTSSPAALQAIGGALATQDADQRVRLLSAAIAADAKCAWAYDLRGAAWRGKGDLARAQDDYDQALALDATFAQAYSDRAAVHLMKGREADALRDLARALELNDCLTDAWYNRGLAHRRGGRLNQALSDYAAAIALNPADPDARRERGNVFVEQRQYDKALADHDRAVELAPDDPEGYRCRAVTHYFRSDYDRAWDDVRRCRARGGEVPPAFLAALVSASSR